MLEKPDLADARIVALMRAEFGLPIERLNFLALGADPNTAVYRAVAETAAAYFVKLRWGPFDPIGVTLPKFLSDHGMRQIIAPIATHAGQLWAGLDAFTLTLYPFVDGRTASAVRLSKRHWNELGAALKHLHTVALPDGLKRHISVETYSSKGRDSVRAFVGRTDGIRGDRVALQLAAFLSAKRDEILDLVDRTERLALDVQARSPDAVVCHSDIHADNVLIDRHGALYIVDWDSPVFAPRERDLMFFGGGQRFAGYTAEEEAVLFYQGYGSASIDRVGLTYYRYERVIQDIAAYCEQLLLTGNGGADRHVALRHLTANFLPDSTLDLARRSDPVRYAEQDMQ